MCPRLTQSKSIHTDIYFQQTAWIRSEAGASISDPDPQLSNQSEDWLTAIQQRFRSQDAEAARFPHGYISYGSTKDLFTILILIYAGISRHMP